MDDLKKAVSEQASLRKTRSQVRQSLQVDGQVYQWESCESSFPSNKSHGHASNETFDKETQIYNGTRVANDGAVVTSIPETMESDIIKETPKGTVQKKIVEKVHMAECYLCTLCGKTFTRRSTLVGHMEIHENKQQEREESDHVFTQARSRKKHMKLQTSKPKVKKLRKATPGGDIKSKSTYKCDICNKDYRCKSLLDVHRRIHTNERPFECTICGRCFKQKATLEDHKTTHTKDRPFECEKCGSRYKQRRGLRQHMKSAACKRKVQKKMGIYIHREKVKVQPQVADSSAPSTSGFKDISKTAGDSIQESHTKKQNGDIKNKTKLNCDICDKDFSCRSLLDVHRRIHTNERPFECEICGRRFKQKITLKDHETTHSKDRPFECEKCGSRYKQLRVLRQHMRSAACQRQVKKNMGEKVKNKMRTKIRKNMVKKVDCEQVEEQAPVVADTSSSNPSGLISVDNNQEAGNGIHVQELPTKKKDVNVKRRHKCDICEKDFKAKCILEIHRRIHTNERPYECGICGRSFKQKITLVDHEATHREGRLFECGKCGSRYKQLRILRQHVKSRACERKLQKSISKQVIYDEQVKVQTQNVSQSPLPNTPGFQNDSQGAGSTMQGYKNKNNCDVKLKRYKCGICIKTFSVKKMRDEHRRIHTNKMPFKCRICGRRFKQKVTLFYHEATHRKDQPFECKKCGSRYKQLRILRQHMKSAACERKLQKKMGANIEGRNDRDIQCKARHKCDICDKHFSAGSLLEIHRRVHTNERPFECGICGRGFKQKITLADHETTHREDRPFECEKCGSKYKQLRTLRQHKKSAACKRKLKKKIGKGSFEDNGDETESSVQDHTEEKNDCESKESSGKKFICDQCGKEFPFKKSFKQHMMCHTNLKPHICNICHKGFKLKSILVVHMKIHVEGKPHKCPTCQKQFKTQRCLQNHTERNICTGDGPFTCEVCNRSFMYPRFLENHRCINAPPKMFKCNMCERTFSRRNLLTEHVRMHTGERPLACEVCGKTFAKRATLRNHILTHSSSKTKKCPQCRKKFPSNTALRRHMMVHSAEKKYACNMCDKTFKQSRSLRVHYMSVHNAEGQVNQGPSDTSHTSGGPKDHTGKKPFACDFCNVRFTRMNSLQRHKMIIHDGVEPFMCGLCGVTFKYKTLLTKHVCSEQQAIESIEVAPQQANIENIEVAHNLANIENLEGAPNLANIESVDVAPNLANIESVEVASNLVNIERVEVAPDLANIEMVAEAAALVQQVPEHILGDIRRAMTEAGIEIEENMQYQIVVGDDVGEVTVQIGDSFQ